jgi:cation diffusion facilitator CzcD-associated flavoprotein CzcO
MVTNAIPDESDVLIIGGGQAGLAAGYYLRRSGLPYRILDAEPAPGGAWQQTWDSLTLFSPTTWSSLPGWIMPGGSARYPTRSAVLTDIAAYEERYQLPITRRVWVQAVARDPAGGYPVRPSAVGCSLRPDPRPAPACHLNLTSRHQAIHLNRVLLERASG